MLTLGESKVNIKYLKSVLTIILTVSYFAIPYKGISNANIPFQLVNGLMIVDAELNGHQGSFIFDTGASDLLVDNSIGLPINSQVEFATISGLTNSGLVSIGNLKVGSILEISNYKAFTIDLQNLKDYTSLNILGIIGGQMFNGIVKVDFMKKEISIVTEQSIIHYNLQSSPIVIKEGVPIIALRIEGKSCNFILDSGASAHIIDNTSIADFDNNQILQSNKKLITAEGISEQIKVVCANMTFLGKDSNERFIIQDLKIIAEELNMAIGGILSLTSLKLDHLYMDFTNKRIYYQ